jgi:hypothetical protein
MKYGHDVQNYELVDSPLAGVYLMRSEAVIISKSVNQNHDYKKISGTNYQKPQLH